MLSFERIQWKKIQTKVKLCKNAYAGRRQKFTILPPNPGALLPTSLVLTRMKSCGGVFCSKCSGVLDLCCLKAHLVFSSKKNKKIKIGQNTYQRFVFSHCQLEHGE